MVTGPYRTRAHANASVVAGARSGAVAYAQSVGADSDVCEAVRLAVSEAVTNVVMHAYQGMERGDVLVEAWTADDGQLCVIDDADIPESTGKDSFLEWLARWDQAWESWRIEELDVRATDDDRAIALCRVVAKGRGSGIELTRADALVASFRDEMAVKLAYYNDQAQALEAVELPA